MNKEEIEGVPPVRVKHYNYETDETEMGTVIESSKTQYTIIPDVNLGITVRWFKHDCDIIR